MMGPRQLSIDRLWNHCDAVIHRADMRTKIAANALVFDHFVMSAISDVFLGNGLMGRILAGDMTKTTPDTGILIDIGEGLELHVELVPRYELRNRPPCQIL